MPPRRRIPRENQNSNNINQGDATEVMGAFRQIADAMRAQAAAAQGMMEMLNRRTDEVAGGAIADVRFSEFQKTNPPEFRGAFSPEVADEWIQELEKIFTVLACSDEQKVAFATYMLKADAAFWWKGAKSLLESDATEITWEVFKWVFYEKYFPATVRRAKELEFMKLQQGGMNVGQYTAKFEELCKYSTIYQRNPDEEWKCMKYEGGLRADILSSVAPMEIKSYAALVNKCRVVEECNRKLFEQRSEAFRKRQAIPGQRYGQPPPKKPYQGGGYKGKQPQRPIGNFQRPVATPSQPVTVSSCSKCGKIHRGTCRIGQNVCFRCGKPGHYLKQCPMNPQSSAPKPQTQGRVFALNAEVASESDDLILGKCEMRGISLTVLFDSGATHSFISYDCARRLNLPISDLPYALNVLIPTDDHLRTDQACLKCHIQLADRIFIHDLICLPLTELDVILGID